MLFTVAPITPLPGSFRTGIDSPVIMDSSTELVPSRTTPSTRDLFAGPNPQVVAGIYLIEGNVLFIAVAQNARGLGAEVEQGANGGAGVAAGSQFEHLSQKHESNDGGSGFEVDRRVAADIADRSGKNAGENGCGQAESDRPPLCPWR